MRSTDVTQQVIAHESGVADFVDALGGSYAVETLTTRIEKAATRYLAHIDSLGGMVQAIEKGYVQREIQNASYRYQLEIEGKQRLIVGQNAFVSEAAPIPLLKIDPAIEREQVERLRTWRAERDESVHAAALERVERAAGEDDNLMPILVEAVKAGGTVGEISDVLRRVWGGYEEVRTL